MPTLFVHLFFLWRRNNGYTVALKTGLFGLLGWGAAAPFTSELNALVSAAFCAGVAALKYLLLLRRDRNRLKAHLGPRRPRQLPSGNVSALADGVARGVAPQATTVSLEPGSREPGPCGQGLRDQQQADAEAALEIALAALAGHLPAGHPGLDTRVAALEAAIQDGHGSTGIFETLASLLPERALSFGYDNYLMDGDHADLVQLVADATDGAWAPQRCQSATGRPGNKCMVRFVDAGSEQVWRFHQRADRLSQNFLRKLLAYAEARTGQVIVQLDADEAFEAVVLPAAVYTQLTQTGLSRAA